MHRIEEKPAAALLDRAADGPAAWAVVAGLILVLFFSNLGGPALWDPDEGRHAEIAREALASGNWLTPTLAGEPYHDKPMAFYWLVGASFRLFGIHEWAARLPSAMAASLTVLAVFLWVRRYVGPAEGLLAAAMLATAGEFLALARFVLIDMTFSFWTSLAALYGGAWLLEGERKGWSPWPLWGCLGVAVLIKGPVALVLVGGAMGAFVLLKRRWECIGAVRPGRGLLLVAAMAGSWYAAAWLRAPDYIAEFVFRHNVERFLTGKPGHPGNPFFYMYVLPAVFLPWSVLWPVAGSRVWRRLRAGADPLVYCALWFAVVFVFFSASRAKLATYMLPLFPPAAILTAAGTIAFLRDPGPPLWQRRVWAGAYVGLCAAALLLPPGAFLVLRHLGEELIARKALLASAVLAPLLLAGLPFLRSGRRELVLVWVLLAAVVAETGFYLAVVPDLSSRYSLREAARRLGTAEGIERVCAWRATAHTLMFYSDMLVHRVEDATAAAEALQEPHTALLTKDKRLPTLRCLLREPVYQWWRSEHGKVLLAPFPHPRSGGRMIRPGGDCRSGDPGAMQSQTRNQPAAPGKPFN